MGIVQPKSSRALALPSPTSYSRLPHARMPRLRPNVAAWSVGLAATCLVIWMPELAFGYRNASLHLLLDSVGACVAVIVAYLVYGRFMRSGKLQDLLLGHCLILMAVAELGLRYVAEGVSGLPAGTLDIWLPMAMQVVGCLLVAAAALVNGHPAKRLVPRRMSVLMPMGVAGALSVVFWIARSQLPVAVEQNYTSSSAQRALLSGHPLLLIVEGIGALSLFVASIAFSWQAARRPDEFRRLLGPACALGGFDRLNNLLMPSLVTDQLYAGDLLRIGFYALLLIGAVREIGKYGSAQAAAAAVLDDRRRFARELHDGVIQELAYIRSESHTLPSGSASGDRIISACDRALDEARAAVQKIDHPSAEPLGFALRRATAELAERYDLDLQADLDSTIRVDSDQQHDLLRITREAIANAVHHGKAKRVRVRLSCHGELRRLSVADDGQGFDVSASVANDVGHGLIGMRERASALPGDFTVRAIPGIGCVVSVQW